MALAGLLGLKPAVETLRELLDAAPFPNQVISNDGTLMITRICEIVFESSPETVIQTVALLATPAAEQSTLQYASLLSSIAAIGALSTLGDRELDTAPERRESEPTLFGYVNRDPLKNMAQLAASAVAISCFTAARMLALGALIVAALERWDGSVVALVPPAGWVAAECGLLAAARMRWGSWHVYRREADSAFARVVQHLTLYVGMATAPFPVWRNVAFLNSHLYWKTLACLGVSNFALAAVAYGVLGGVNALPAEWAWQALGTLTLAAWVAAFALVACAPPKMRKSFYEVKTYKMHIKSRWWDELDEMTLDTNNDGVELYGQEAVRAHLPTWCCRPALPIEELKALYEERWAAWEAAPPDWFIPAFQESIDDDLVPAYVLAARIEARKGDDAESGTLTRVFSRKATSVNTSTLGSQAPPTEAWSQRDIADEV